METLFSTIVVLLPGVVAVTLLISLLRTARSLEKAANNPTFLYQYSHHPKQPYVLSKRSFEVGKVDVDFSLIIPCYNEATRILKTLQNVTTFFNAFVKQSIDLPLRYEVIVVDDGSKDDTIEVVQDFFRNATHDKESLRIFKLPKNSGKGAAVTEGMLRSRGIVCLFLDADDATEISEFRTLHGHLAHLLNLGHISRMDRESYYSIAHLPGCVIGSRSHLQFQAAASRSVYRNFLTRGFHALVWIVTRTPIGDTQCGFKLFTREAVHRIFPHIKIRRWCFDVELLFLAGKNGVPIEEVPVKWTEVPGSKVRMHHIIHMAWELGVILVGYTLIPSWKTWKQRSKNT